MAVQFASGLGLLGSAFYNLRHMSLSLRDSRAFGCARAFTVARTTTSSDRIVGALLRKLSRTIRFIRFRSTARATVFRLIARPSLGYPSLFKVATSLNASQLKRFPFANVSINSSCFSSLIVFGKVCSVTSKTEGGLDGGKTCTPFSAPRL